MRSRTVLGTRVDATDYRRATARICRWARSGESRCVCAANVYTVMLGHDHPGFRDSINAADLVTADGMPLAWALRLLGVPGAGRVYGPDLTLAVAARAAAEGIPVGLHGGTPEALAALEQTLTRRYSGLRVVHHASPPFRELTAQERDAERAAINRSGARILFVGLGCPHQETWMAEERGRVGAVMLGVGAAFDFIPRLKPQAPPLLRRLGLEWLFRLATEPRRLWRRYLVHNPRFLVLFALQLVRGRAARPTGPAHPIAPRSTP